MGNYLSTPNTTKYVENGESHGLRYSICEMQGWRVSMEDAHLAYIFKSTPHSSQVKKSSQYPVALFGVYDGHGGCQVSRFVSRHLLQEFLKTQEFKTGHYAAAFKTVYIMLDYLLSLPEGQAELEMLATDKTSGLSHPLIHNVPGGDGKEPRGKKGNQTVHSDRERKVLYYRNVFGRSTLSKDKGGGQVEDPIKGSGSLTGMFSHREQGHSVDVCTKEDKNASSISLEKDLEVSTSFESLGVSEEYPIPKVTRKQSGVHHPAVTKRLNSRRRKECHRKKKMDFLTESSFTNQLFNKNIHATCSSFKGKLLSTVKVSESTRSALATKVSPYRERSEKRGALKALKRNQHTVPSSSVNSPCSPSSPCSSSSPSSSSSSCSSSSSSVSTSSSNVTFLGNLFNMQNFKSFISTVARFGSSVGRHANTNGTTFSSYTGCTALTVLLTTSQIVVANAGDSRCVLCRGNIAVELSRDHKPSLEDERARIYAAGGWLEMGRVNGNLNLSRAIGDLVYKSNTSLTPERQVVSVVPDIVIVDISDRDSFLILGCDGIWESMTSQDIVDFVAERINTVENLHEILEALFEELVSPNPTILECGCDNMTAILVDLKPHSRSFSLSKRAS